MSGPKDDETLLRKMEQIEREYIVAMLQMIETAFREWIIHDPAD
jgi:hypothetical protein